MDEGQIIKVHRSWRSVIFQLLFAIAIGLVGVYLSIYTSIFDARLSFGSHGSYAIDLPIFLLLFIYFGIRPLILKFDSECLLSSHHLRNSTGICSLRRRDTNVPYEDLKGVRVERTIIDRILGIGTIIAWTYSSDNPEVRITGVAHPQKTAQIISSNIDEALIALK